MNTPDGYESQDGGTESGSRVKPLLRTTKWSGHRSGAFERVLFKVSAALRPLIAAHLTEEHSLLFAEPVIDSDTGEVSWHSPVEGEAVAYVELTREDQAATDTHVNQLLFDLLELARKLQAEPKTLEDYVMGQLLELLLDDTYSERECLYLVGYQPVFAFWAFESGNTPDAFAPPTDGFLKHGDAGQVRREPATAAGAATTEARRARAASKPWSGRQWAIGAGVAAVLFLAIFGLNPRATVISWLDKMETIRAGEQALLRIIGRDEKARTSGVSDAEIEAEMAGGEGQAGAGGAQGAAQPAAPPEEFAEPMPPFEGARGKVPIEKLQGSILLLHFWSASDPEVCREITSFVSMVTSERFDPLRELGGEAYLVTNEESADKGNLFLKTCGVQDPFLLRDPGGAILKAIAPNATPPATVVFDKLTERTLSIYPRRNWLDPALAEELQRLFLMQAF